MKQLFFIEDTVTNTISYWLLAAFLITLPFDQFYSEIILFVFALHTFLHCNKASFKRLCTKQVPLLTAVYWVTVIAIAYSTDKKEGFSIATKQLAIFAFPVLLALTRLRLHKYYLRLFVLFTITITGTIIYLYIDAWHTTRYFHLPLSSLFTAAFMNHNFSLPIEMHATYLSIYVAFSIMVLVYLLAAEKRLRVKMLYISCIVLLAAGLLQLSSRAVVIALLLMVNILVPFSLLKTKTQRIKFCLVSGLLSALLLFGILSIDAFKTRYISDLRKDLSDKLPQVEIEESRVARWEAIAGLIRQSPLIGYGTGSQQHLLQDKYFEQKLYSAYLNHLNTHNEYLSFILNAGVIGLLVLLYVLFAGFVVAWRQHDFLFTGFLLLVSMVFISENVLDVNKGIFFYSFFFSVFLLKDSIKRKPVQATVPADSTF